MDGAFLVASVFLLVVCVGRVAGAVVDRVSRYGIDWP